MKAFFVIVLVTFSIPVFPMHINVDVNVNVMNGDGNITSGDKNDTSDERSDCGSSREDASEDNRENTNNRSK